MFPRIAVFKIKYMTLTGQAVYHCVEGTFLFCQFFFHVQTIYIIIYIIISSKIYVMVSKCPLSDDQDLHVQSVYHQPMTHPPSLGSLDDLWPSPPIKYRKLRKPTKKTEKIQKPRKLRKLRKMRTRRKLRKHFSFFYSQCSVWVFSVF